MRNFADTKVSAEGGGGGAPGAGAEIPLQPLEKTMVRQAVPLQPMGDGGEQRFHLQPMEDPTPEQVETPEGGCDPVGSPGWSKLLAGPVDHGERSPRQGRFSGRTCDSVGDPTLEQIAPEGLHPVGDSHVGEVHERLSPKSGSPGV